MQENTPPRLSMSANMLKFIAITAMLIDHIAWRFVPSITPAGFIMHVIGRLTMPVMCFFIAEGFYHTRDVKRYALRLFMFALISQVPFTYQKSGRLLPQFQSFDSIPESFNVIFTLLLGLLALWAIKSELNISVKTIIAAGCCLFAVACDWAFFGVLYVLAFGLNRDDFKMQALWFSVISAVMISLSVMGGAVQLFQLGTLLSLPLLYLYNGKRGGHAWSKWVFYVFYPLHLLIIGLIVFGF